MNEAIILTLIEMLINGNKFYFEVVPNDPYTCFSSSWVKIWEGGSKNIFFMQNNSDYRRIFYSLKGKSRYYWYKKWWIIKI